MNQGNLRGTGIRKLPSGRYQIAFRDGNGVEHRESFDREKDARTLSAIFDKHLALRTIRIPGELSLALKKWKFQCPPKVGFGFSKS